MEKKKSWTRAKVDKKRACQEHSKAGWRDQNMAGPEHEYKLLKAGTPECLESALLEA